MREQRLESKKINDGLSPGEYLSASDEMYKNRHFRDGSFAADMIRNRQGQLGMD